MRALLIATGLLLAPVAPAGAQITLDLAHTGSRAEPVEPGSVEIVIENRQPRVRYDVVIRREAVPLQAFSIEAIGSLPTGPTGVAGPGPECADLAAATSALDAVTSESQVPAARAIVKDLIDAGSCTDPTALVAAKTVVRATTESRASLAIGQGERITMTVTRPAAEGQTITWTLTLSTHPRGEWFLTYGFSLTNSGDDFTTAPAAEGGFRVIEKSHRRALAPPTPAVFFSWLARSQKNQNLSFSPSVGLGLEDGVPALFAGLAITFNENISLLLGGGATSQKRLYERYRTDPVIAEELEDAQLHERQYSLAPIVGISLRFDKNPFKKADPPTAPPPEGGTTPSTALAAKQRRSPGR